MTAARLATPTLGEVVARAAALAADGERRLLGIAGPPGAGKSTLARAMCEALDGRAVLVPMDGFHRSNEQLVAAGRIAPSAHRADVVIRSVVGG